MAGQDRIAKQDLASSELQGELQSELKGSEQWNTVSILGNDATLSFCKQNFDPCKSITNFANFEIENGSDNPKQRDPQYDELANKHQLDLRSVQENGRTQYEFYSKIDGQEQVVLKSEQPPKQVEEQLKQAQEAKVKELEKAYNIDIACDGETTKSVDKKKDLQVTTPTLGELAAIEQALLHSVPDTETVTGNPLRIVVGDESWGKDFGAGGVKRDDEIVFAYSANISYLKEVGVHELAHIGQAQREHSSGYDGYAQELGWVKAAEDWLLRGKDGSFWQNTGENGIWIRTDRDGNPADSNGKRVDNPFNPFDHGEDNGRVQKLNEKEVRELAVVKPFSTYFGNPHEMGAAMLTPYRDNRKMRADLYKVSADSYQVAKNLDQYQINAALGTQADGQPKFLRNPDGIVGENTPENRQEIQQFESKLAREIAV